MKQLKKNKIVVMLAMLGSLTFIPAQAQWAVTNVNDTLFFGPTGVFTQMMGKMNMALNSNLQSMQATQKVMIAQQDTNLAVTDSRSRRAAGLLEIAKRDNLARPTLQQCAEVSKTAYKASAISGSLRGSRRPGAKPSGAPETTGEIAELMVSSAAVATEALKNMKNHGTCSTTYGKTADCSGDGAFPQGDILPMALKSNMKGAAAGADFANWSLDKDGQVVAQDYVNLAVLGNAPRKPAGKQLEKNPSYLATYKSLMIKLKAAEDVLVSISNFRVGSALGSSVAKNLWNNATSKYSQIWGGTIKAPAEPSMFEIVNLNVYSDYLIPETEDAAESTRKRLALNNYISWKQLQAQEDTNILLAHMLIQLTTPADKNKADGEYTTTVSMK